MSRLSPTAVNVTTPAPGLARAPPVARMTLGLGGVPRRFPCRPVVECQAKSSLISPNVMMPLGEMFSMYSNVLPEGVFVIPLVQSIPMAE